MGPRALVFDIEGTLCPISFVKDKLYPYALKRAANEIPKLQFPVTAGGNEDDIGFYVEKFPPEHRSSAQAVLDHIRYLTENDVKSPYLKALQGFLWKSGYDRGELKVDLFPDVLPALNALKSEGKLYIYSSGSVMAQKLLFSHTEQGDLTNIFSGYFDTVNAGPKIEKKSYDVIASAIGQAPSKIRFYSDNPKEIEAAHESGFQTIFIVRPGNPEFPYFESPGSTASSIQY